MTIGEYIKDTRETCSITQKQLADALGYTTPQFVSNWERGLSMPPMSAAKKICKALPIIEPKFFYNLYLKQFTTELDKHFKWMEKK